VCKQQQRPDRKISINIGILPHELRLVKKREQFIEVANATQRREIFVIDSTVNG
jgi:hypothetical protein